MALRLAVLDVLKKMGIGFSPLYDAPGAGLGMYSIVSPWAVSQPARSFDHTSGCTLLYSPAMLSHSSTYGRGKVTPSWAYRSTHPN